MEKKQRPTLLTEKPKPKFPTRVEIDNEVSEDYTVIDIYTHDKVGLLYRITSTLTDLGLYIGVSKISTKVDQVADVFYVKDIFGHKVTNPDKTGGSQGTAAEVDRRIGNIASSKERHGPLSGPVSQLPAGGKRAREKYSRGLQPRCR